MEIRDIIVAVLDYFHFDLVLLIFGFMLFFKILHRLIKDLNRVSFDSEYIGDEDIEDQKSFNPYYDE